MSSDISLAGSHDGGAALGHEAAEHERQFREILDFCPAPLYVISRQRAAKPYASSRSDRPIFAHWTAAAGLARPCLVIRADRPCPRST
jgi:hypothetical protein